MDLLSFIYGFELLIRNYSILFTLVTSLILGEEIILILSFLSANGFLPLWIVFVFCFAGRIVSDFFFFTLGKLGLAGFFKKYQGRAVYNTVDMVFSKLNRKSLFATLLYTKFLVGLRAAMMIYIGVKGVSLKRALLSDIGAVFIWLLVLIPIGWFAGSSFKMILNAFNDLRIAVLFLIAIAFIIILVHNHIHKKIRGRRI